MKKHSSGYIIGVIAIALALIWIGIFKFTHMEAMGIQHYVQNSFLLSWLYKILSLDAVAMLIGTIEIITGILIVASFWFRQAGRIGGLMGIVTFIITLSFLFTTPMTWKMVEGVPMTDFFVLKDLAFLAIAVQVFERSKVTVA